MMKEEIGLNELILRMEFQSIFWKENMNTINNKFQNTLLK
jgi:hypothetical protein